MYCFKLLCQCCVISFLDELARLVAPLIVSVHGDYITADVRFGFFISVVNSSGRIVLKEGSTQKDDVPKNIMQNARCGLSKNTISFEVNTRF